MSLEFTIINEIFRRRVSGSADVLLGIGDDAALTRLPPGCDLVTATDALVAGTHFLPDEPARSIGHRCLAVNLSDLAAMAAEPLWASLALGLPDFDRPWLEDFAGGFFELADRFAVDLIGGDTVRSEILFASVTAQGSVPKNGGVRRSGARPGDLICVTGSPGDAAAGRRLASLAPQPDAKQVESMQSLCQRFYYPEPRIHVGRMLASVATSMIDLSDGLHTDLGRLLEASGVGAILDVEQLPFSPAILRAFDVTTATELALCGGDDYELCFTVPADRRAALEDVAASAECRLTVIGAVEQRPGLSWARNGATFVVPASAFEHFA